MDVGVDSCLEFFEDGRLLFVEKITTSKDLKEGMRTIIILRINQKINFEKPVSQNDSIMEAPTD